jgi:predicted DNA-binding transcriptional regulator AlpA
MPKLMRVEQIADLADLAVGTVYNLATKPDFPAPVEVIGTANFFHPADVSLWLKNRVDGRKARRKARRK